VREMAPALFLSVSLGTPLMAQDRSPRDLEFQFPNAVSYEVFPDVLMTPKFTVDDHICEMSFRRLPRTPGGEQAGVSIPDGDVHWIATLWAATSLETKRKGFNGASDKTQNISGNVKTTIYNFEETTMKVYGRNDNSPATFVLIQWKNRTCKDPASKNPWEGRSIFQLLPGYKMTLGSGIEGGAFGTIWKDGGPSIRYSFDVYGGFDVESIPRDQELWREEQTSGINKFVLVYTRSQELVVSMIYPERGNFQAKIHDRKDLAEVLLTILSTDLHRGYPIDADRIQLNPPPKN
jgi:hypothetical protein